jgi:hypothetical protein
MPQTEIIFVDYRQLYEDQLSINSELESLVDSLQQQIDASRKKEPPMSNLRYQFMTNLQYKVKSLTSRVKGFESGEKYVDMKAEFKRQLAEKDREIKKLKAELADANARNATMRENWLQVFDDLEKAQNRELMVKGREIKAMEERALNAERQRDDTKDKLLDKTKELYSALTELEDEKGKVLKLKAQINRDHENSSSPSSMNPNRKKIINTREKSGKKPGGQIGHKHHPRKRHTPTISIDIPPPTEYADSPDYVETGKIITKQVVNVKVMLVVTEYSTPEFRNVHTGVRVSAEFPGDLVDDVTYGGSIKSLAFLLNNHCNVSIGKCSEIISELTGGELNLSTGMICGLSKQFSLKTEAEQKKAFANLLLEPVMNVDFTTVRVNGKNKNVLVCATPDNVLYFAREHKGHEGVKGTPIEDYQGNLVHDHDVTFYKYGANNQECNDHPLRYLKGSMQNETNLKWNLQMRDLIREMIHFRKHLDPKDKRNPDEIDPNRVKALEKRYDEILDLAKEEYEYDPPSKYNLDGFNLYKRLHKYKANHLLFLHDWRVPYTNSLSERLLRIIKRKQHQVMSFRSFGGLEYLCNCLGTIATMRSQGNNIYEGIANIFDRSPKADGKVVD